MDACLFCREPATHLCDKALAFVLDGEVKVRGQAPYMATSMEAMLSGSYTCDAPFCSKHGKSVGHICGLGDGCETIDHCIGNHSAGQPRLMTLEKIAELRASLHQKWQSDITNDRARKLRGQFTVIPKEPQCPTP